LFGIDGARTGGISAHGKKADEFCKNQAKNETIAGRRFACPTYKLRTFATRNTEIDPVLHVLRAL
jgi:hypothetical protein